MTTYEEQARKFSQRPVTLVDVVTPYCSLKYGRGICAPLSRELLAIESSAGWTPGSAGSSISDDSTWSLNGDGSMAIGKTGTSNTWFGAYRSDLSGTGDLSGRTLRIGFKAESSWIALMGATALKVRLGDSNPVYHDWNLASSLVKEGVNVFEFEWDSPTSTLGSPTDEPTYFAVYGYMASSGSTLAYAFSVDDFLLLTDLPAPEHCYNTRATCSDPQHFYTQKSTKTFRFSGERAPIVTGATGPTIIPAIRSRGISMIPSKIDVERGYGRRDRIEVKLTDFEDDDRFTDPYRSIRNKKPASTFFKKFMARNPYLKGRPLILREGLGIDDQETGRVRVNLDEFKTRRYIIDRVNGPDKQGVVTILAKDILKDLDGRKIPSPSDAAIDSVNAVDNSQTVIELEEGGVDNLLEQHSKAGVSLSSGLFFIRAGDELMLVTAASSGSNFMTVSRGALGSTAEEHSVDTAIQYVQSWQNERVDDIWYDIQSQCDVDPSLIGYSDFQDEVDNFMPEYRLTAHISKPTKASEIMQDLNIQSGIFTWWDAEDQVTRAKPIRPMCPGEDVEEFSDEESIVGGTANILRQEEKRITNAFIWFNPINWSGDLGDSGNYREGVLYVDADAESEDQYGDQKSKTLLNYFYPSGSAASMRSVASRYMQKFRDAPGLITCTVTTKDAHMVKPGDFVNILTDGLVNFNGRPVARRMMVISKKRLDPYGIKWEFTLDEFEFVNAKFAFWAPDTAPDYDDATSDDLEYAYWADDNGLLPDTSEPYLWV